MKDLTPKLSAKLIQGFSNMSKNFRKFRANDEYEEDDYYDRAHRDELKQRRKIKRMRNALKTRNIDELMDMDAD